MNFHKFDYGTFGNVFILKDEPDPQEAAMLAAMYSRSTDSVEDMVEKVKKNGAGKFLETYYVGYGHESIGDLVEVKLFLEGIPLFMAPLIEHYALFRGQETSTRYIDFSKQRLFGKHQGWMLGAIDRYLRALTTVTNKLRDINKPENLVQERAVRARAFDICRGLVPLGAVTNVAWYGDIRSIKGHLAWMRDAHPWSFPWVLKIYESLKHVFPQSMERELEAIHPRRPWVFDAGDGKVVLQGTLDFGSWRDLNRHRVGRHNHFRLPEFTASLHSFYLDLLSRCGADVSPPQCANWISGERNIDTFGCLLLGQLVLFRYEMPESQADYFCWRRNQMDVHPSLRLLVQDLALQTGRLREAKPDVGLGYVEKRGAQTIIHKIDQA